MHSFISLCRLLDHAPDAPLREAHSLDWGIACRRGAAEGAV